MKPPSVLLLGRFGPPQLACLRSWRAAGLRVGFLHLADRGPLRHTPRRLAGYEPLRPGLLRLADAGARLRGMFDGWDAVTAVAYRELAFLGALAGPDRPPGVVCAPSAEALAFHLAKSPQIALARAVGLAVLPTWELRASADAAAVPAGAFPLVLRPDTDEAATPAFKVRLARDRAALDRALARLAPGFHVVAQPFADGPNLVVHGVRAADGRQGPQRAFLVDWKYEGVTQRLRGAPLDPALAARCAEFVARAEHAGVYHFEFLARPGGEPLFLEINGRFGGTTAKALRLGWDEPLMQLRAFGVLPWTDAPGSARGGSATNRLALLKRLAGLARGRASPLDYPRGGRARVAAGLLAGLAAWRDEVADVRDWRGTADFYRETWR